MISCKLNSVYASSESRTTRSSMALERGMSSGYRVVLWLAKVAGTRKRGMQKVELGKAMSGF